MRDSVQQAIEAEQAKTLNRGLPAKSIGNALAAVAMSAALSTAIPLSHVLLWTALIFCNELVTAIVVIRLRRGIAFKSTKNNLRFLVASTTVSGIVWGFGWLLFAFHPQAPERLFFIYLCTFAMLNSAVVLRGHYLPLFMGYLLPFGTMTIAYLLSIAHDTASLALALGTLLYASFMALIARAFSQAFMAALRLRFENDVLVQQLTLQKQAAESANLAKSRFLAAASHDLRQPMHALTLYLGALNNRPLRLEDGNLLRNAMQCAGTMDEMFRALLDMSRLDATLVTPTLKPFPVNDVLEHMRLQFAPVASTKQLVLRVAPSSAWVFSDVAMVQRILNNLVSNAVRYTQRGKILVGCQRRGERLRIAVFDTGPGIAEKDFGAIFEEFFQVGNKERDRSKGLGLGLAIVKRLSELLDSNIQVRSIIGKGSCFSIDLPLIKDASSLNKLTPTSPSATKTDPTLITQAGLIVVIDDEKDILQATRALLEQWRYTVITASSSEQAIYQLSQQTQRPDAIICDYRLPGDESGLDVIAKLRSEFNHEIPAVLITGDTGPQPLQEIHGSGLPVMHKPLSESGLRNTLAQLLR